MEPKGPWSKLREHYAKQETYPLDILVWGPAESEDIEYKKRCEIREALNKAGHNACFSEDLMKDRLVQDPLEEELLQADAANLIVVLYGSRGTQTEVDTLLGYSRFAEKALIFIDEHMLEKVIRSVSGGRWQKLQRQAQVVPYSTEQLQACQVVAHVRDWAQKLRRAVYVAKVREEAGSL